MDDGTTVVDGLRFRICRGSSTERLETADDVFRRDPSGAPQRFYGNGPSWAPGEDDVD